MTQEKKERIVDDISKIRVNPDNHSLFNLDPQNHFHFNKCLDVHNDIDLYLTHKLGAKSDISGKYASFLDDIGIESNSDNGWWSKYAVDPKNIEAFISYYSDCDDHGFGHQYDTAIRVYEKLKKVGFARHKHKLVIDAVTALNSIN